MFFGVSMWWNFFSVMGILWWNRCLMLWYEYIVWVFVFVIGDIFEIEVIMFGFIVGLIFSWIFFYFLFWNIVGRWVRVVCLYLIWRIMLVFKFVFCFFYYWNRVFRLLVFNVYLFIIDVVLFLILLVKLFRGFVRVFVFLKCFLIRNVLVVFR